MSDANSHQKASGPGRQAGADSTEATNTSGSTTASSSDYKMPSKYQFVKQNWGNRLMFQLSHGLKENPDDWEEGNRILDGYMECERDRYEDRSSQGKNVHHSHPLHVV